MSGQLPFGIPYGEPVSFHAPDASGSNSQFTFAAGFRYWLIGFEYLWTTGAAVGARNPGLNVSLTGSMFRVGYQAQMPVSSSALITFWIGAGVEYLITPSTAGTSRSAMPDYLLVNGGETISTSAQPHAGDTFTNVFIYTLRFAIL